MRWLLLLLCVPCALGLEFSEILFDPIGADNGLEFIELVGEENLTGCMITDSASSDILVPVQQGGSVILIVEEDAIFAWPGDATVYHAGKAIGNGLGNSEETLVISCEAEVASTNYNVLDIEGYAPGLSIVYDGTWKPGIENGTPGLLDVQEEEVEEAAEEYSFCNTTLVITLSATEGYPGDNVRFTVVADGIARFEALADDAIFLEGDTLSLDEYSFALPDAESVKIVARAEQCDARQRATRIITVLERNETQENATVMPPGEEKKAASEKNETVVVDSGIVEKQRAPAEAAAPEPLPATASVAYDADVNIVPWVSAFGIVTLLVSAALFWKMSRTSSEQ